MAITRQNTLPDPNNNISTTGAGGAGTNSAGVYEGASVVGFKSVKIDSEAPVMKTRTNSGRLVSRAIVGHKYTVNITYNPMTRAQFEPIFNFLLDKRGGLKPFFVVLPQNKDPQDSNLSNNTIRFVGDHNRLIVNNRYEIATASTTSWTSLGAAAATTGTVFTRNDVASNTGSGTVKALAGSTSMVIDTLGSNNPMPGDMFTITDSSDINHTKAYKVTRVETPDSSDNFNNLAGSVTLASSDRVIHFIPALQRKVTDNSELDFTSPKMRVILASDVQSYSLDVNNLYSFSLNLEEAQP